MSLDVKNFSTLKIKMRASWSLPFRSKCNDSREHEGASELLVMFWIWILGA